MMYRIPLLKFILPSCKMNYSQASTIWTHFLACFCTVVREMYVIILYNCKISQCSEMHLLHTACMLVGSQRCYTCVGNRHYVEGDCTVF